MWPEDTTKTVLSKIYKDFYAKGYITKKYVASDFKDKTVLLILLEGVTEVYKLPLPTEIEKAVQKTKEEHEKYLEKYDPLKLFKASENYFVPKRIFDMRKFVNNVNEIDEKDKDKEKDGEEEEKEGEEDEEQANDN